MSPDRAVQEPLWAAQGWGRRPRGRPKEPATAPRRCAAVGCGATQRHFPKHTETDHTPNKSRTMQINANTDSCRHEGHQRDHDATGKPLAKGEKGGGGETVGLAQKNANFTSSVTGASTHSYRLLPSKAQHP
jgi:hypothetical protein